MLSTIYTLYLDCYYFIAVQHDKNSKQNPNFLSTRNEN